MKHKNYKRPASNRRRSGYKPPQPPEEDKGMRLNKFLAHCGVASRRKADELIKAGKVAVNGEVILEMGYRVRPADKVTFEGKRISPERKAYILINKPRGFVTTTSDEKGRSTVMDLIENATDERVYPVGRLDRNTTGLLVLTNDGELAQKLSHPSKEIEKVYFVQLDRPFERVHFKQLSRGIELEDGFIKPDNIAWPEPGDRRKIGLSIHSGRNRIVRRMFEHFEYDVKKLDRVAYATLTKKGLPRGKFRYLTEKEVIWLKHFL